jgi:hypothetical protein
MKKLILLSKFLSMLLINSLNNFNQQSMKKHFFLLMFMACVLTFETYAKLPAPNSDSKTSIGMVIYSNDTETV